MLVISAVILQFTRARYRVTESIPLVNGVINYTPYDFKIMAMYQQNESGEYEKITTMPSSGYMINETESYCTVDGESKDSNARLYTNGNGEHVISGLQEKSKCYLYFDEATANSTILAGKDIQERTDFSTPLTIDTYDTIYKEDTSEGTTYYFAGNTNVNWLYFAGFYWRIVRVNEDGSIRIIYNGTNMNVPEDGVGSRSFGGETNITSVMYMYGSNSSSASYESATENINDSPVKEGVDEWYEENLLDTEYEQYISTEAGFCGDRSSYIRSGSSGNYTYTPGGGTNNTELTYFGAATRLSPDNAAEIKPTFDCPNENDLYTVASSSKGNKALTYPIGLISADEIAYAGGVYGEENEAYYLYSNYTYWTMTPLSYRSYLPNVYLANTFSGYGSESLGSTTTDWQREIRPVINLRSDITLAGDGTTNNPFTVVG